MNRQFSKFLELLSEQFSSQSLSVSKPMHPTGVWYVDIDDEFSFQWQEEKGVGVSKLVDADFGTNPDHSFLVSESQRIEECEQMAIAKLNEMMCQS